jgi:hypothetical protein
MHRHSELHSLIVKASIVIWRYLVVRPQTAGLSTGFPSLAEPEARSRPFQPVAGFVLPLVRSIAAWPMQMDTSKNPSFSQVAFSVVSSLGQGAITIPGVFGGVQML